MIALALAISLLPQGPEHWAAQTIHSGDDGVWYAHVDQVVEAHAPPEVIATDDAGRLFVLSVYSGKWTPHQVTPDRQWLAPSRPADIDPRLPGRELYAAGQAGSIHQVTLRPQPFARFTLESREIGHVAAEEFHTVLTAELAEGAGAELLAFGISGAVYRASPSGAAGAFRVERVGHVGGRVRDALVAELPGSERATVLGVSRAGHLLAMQLDRQGLTSRVVLHESQGLGRIARGRKRGTFYVTRDDGVLLRVMFDAPGDVAREPILVTDQGLRGVAAGRFFADDREAVAVYGYNGIVQLVSRGPDGSWQVTDIWTGAQKGHWLTTGELDGRNSTDELVAAGFDGEVVLLSRRPGYGLEGVARPRRPLPVIR